MKCGARVFAALLLAWSLGAPPAPAGAEGPEYVPQAPADTTAPTATIELSAFRARTRTARFWFYASEPAQGFLCQLDKGGFKPCGSPRTYKHLEPGRHAFRVKAVDLAGNVGAAALVRFKTPHPRRHRR
ncbi:MAG TPA: hypothetical protein VFL77_00105 [Solirubrobacterales bacterium]|nr:hypothetical protein [Solirubrobacterales bacterium]